MPTPIDDIDHKLDIIDHINLDHNSEVLLLAKAFTPHGAAQRADIKDIYQEGVLLNVYNTDSGPVEAFVPFQLKGELEEQILYLAFVAASKQGKTLGRGAKRFFSVRRVDTLTPNFSRIEIDSPTPLPDQQPGYAYWFALTTLHTLPNTDAQTTTNSRFNQWMNRAMLWLMKRLPAKRRQRMMRSMNQNGRYYTLRQTWRSSDTAQFADRGSIDVYSHGDTPGSRWAHQLKAGDVIYSQAEVPNRQAHLTQGQAVLIADETAYPALAGIIDAWENPSAPHLLILSTMESEQLYFDAEALNRFAASVSRIICPVTQQAEQSIAILSKIEHIDTIWGALEDGAAKTIRHYLRNTRKLTGQNNRVKAYWRRDKSLSNT